MSGEFSREDRLLGTGAQLSAYLDKLVEDDKMHTELPSMLDMGKLLAERIDDGVIPIGYVVATEILIQDCQEGVSGFAWEIIPSNVSGMPPVIYKMFRLDAQRFARGAFGDEFGDQVDEAYIRILAQPEQPADPSP